MSVSPAIATKSYAERQLLVVVAAEHVSTTQRMEVEETPTETARKRELPKALSAVAGVVGSAIEGLSAWARARQQGLNVAEVSRSEANSLVFPPGHPRESILYVGHPAHLKIYLPMAGFHRGVFEHKFAESIRLLMYLGAQTIRVEHVRGWSHEFAAQLALPLATRIVQASAGVGKKARSSSHLLFEATLTGGPPPTELPDDLVWLPYESTWQMIAEGRIRSGLKDFALTVSYEDDYGIHAGLKAKVKKSGLDVGGNFESHQKTIWRIVGAFGPAGREEAKPQPQKRRLFRRTGDQSA
jgi:hypothetical protein